MQNKVDMLPLIASDSDIAQAIADDLVDVQRVPPYKLAVWHDAKAGPCSLPVHSIIDNGRMCMVEYQSASDARAWIVKALRMGYRVARQEGRDWRVHEYSVKEIRRDLTYRLKRASMTPEQREKDDSEIPF